MSDAQTTPATEAPATTAPADEPEDKVVYKMKLDIDHLHKGDSIQVAGLGTFENGATHDITESMHNQFRVQNSTFKDIVDDDNSVVAVETIPGPTLLQAFADRDGINVTANKKGGNS
jgi:hypothetical protein